LVEDSDGPREPCVRLGPDPPVGRGNFERGKGRPIVNYRDTAVIYAKTAEPIKMLFGLWARMGPRNHVRWGGVPEMQRDVALATNFWLLMGCNFGCLILGVGCQGQAIQ